MQHVFIVNPIAGKKDAGHLLVPRIEQAAKKQGIQADFLYTGKPRHAVSLAADVAAQGKPVRLYAVGGDGTLNEVFCGALPFENAQVASIPCGSGNDFVRSFGRVEDFLQLEENIMGQAIPIDLIRVDPQGDAQEWLQEGAVCAAITSTGLDADVAYNIPKYRRFPLLGGSMAYTISVLEKLLHPLGKQLRIVVDGKEMEDSYLIAAVCNGKTYGGGYCAAPMANLQDGLLDMILVKKIGRLKVAQIIGKYKQGLHYQKGRVVPLFEKIMVHVRGKEISMQPIKQPDMIINIDGECGPAPRLYAKVMPGVARFVLPKQLYAQQLQQGAVRAE